MVKLDPPSWNLVGDLPGGTRQAMLGWAKYADTVLVVVEPTVKSIHVGPRLRNLADADWAPAHLAVVANKITGEDDVRRIEERVGLPVVCAVPVDPDVLTADRTATAPLDGAEGPFVESVRALVGSLRSSYSVP